VGGRDLIISFLRNEESHAFRIVALEEDNCDSFELDLTLDDLYLLAESNMRILEEDVLPDFCDFLQFNLSFVQRTLAVNHKIFFAENIRVHHKAEFELRAKLLHQKFEKRKLGLYGETHT